jgi:hypothetical protein
MQIDIIFEWLISHSISLDSFQSDIIMLSVISITYDLRHIKLEGSSFIVVIVKVEIEDQTVSAVLGGITADWEDIRLDSDFSAHCKVAFTLVS